MQPLCDDYGEIINPNDFAVDDLAKPIAEAAQAPKPAPTKASITLVASHTDTCRSRKRRRRCPPSAWRCSGRWTCSAKSCTWTLRAASTATRASASSPRASSHGSWCVHNPAEVQLMIASLPDSDPWLGGGDGHAGGLLRRGGGAAAGQPAVPALRRDRQRGAGDQHIPRQAEGRPCQLAQVPDQGGARAGVGPGRGCQRGRSLRAGAAQAGRRRIARIHLCRRAASDRVPQDSAASRH